MYVCVSGSYKPRRDIPIAVRQLKTFSPSRIRDWIREHRTKKDKQNGNRVQVNVTPESITMWFKRHPKVHETLKKEIVEEELPREAISEAIFQNGFFQEIRSVKNWIIDLTNKGAKDRSIKGYYVNGLRNICMGKAGNEIIPDWGLKHPDRLTLEDAKRYIYELRQRGLRTRHKRLVLRNFLESKGIVVKSSDISGELEEDAGKYSDLFVSKEKIYAILAWLKRINRDAYLASKFAYKTATRLTATLNAHAFYINFDEQKITVFEKATKGKKKRKIVKVIPPDLWEELPKEGKLFNIKARELNALLRQAYKEVIPEIADRIPQPFHFWRHMFAQHMLRASNWNYGLVAKLGAWTTEALEKYYGEPPEEVIRKFGMETLPKI